MSTLLAGHGHVLRTLLVVACCLVPGHVADSADKAGPIPVPDGSGVFRKVIVNRDGVQLRSSPDELAKGRDVKPFSIFFQLYTPDGAESQDGWVYVGNQAGESYGWLQQESETYAWNTRYVFKPSSNQSGPRFEVKATRPTQFTARYTGSAGGKTKAVVVPILGPPKKKDGRDFYEVALYAAEPSTAQSGGIARAEAIQTSEMKVEVVFVIDTTASMTGLLNGTIEVAAQLARQLASNPEIRQAFRFGLVQYRDSEPEILFRGPNGKPSVTQRVSSIGSVDQLTAGLAQIKVAEEGSGEVQEDVVAGLLEAIRNAGWSKGSSKHIILMGDASAHLPGSPKSTTGLGIEQVLEIAQGNNGTETDKRLTTFYLHAVRADQPGVRRTELARCESQFRMLADNAGDFDGFYSGLNPMEKTDRQRVIGELTEFFDKGIAGLTAQRSGDAEKLRNLAEQGGQNNQLTQALWLVEQAVNGKPIQVVSLGTTSDRSAKGDLLAQKQVLISEDGLRRVRSILDLLLISLGKQIDPTQRGDVGNLLKAIQKTLADVVTGQDLDEDTQLDVLINKLPLRTEVLRTSVGALASRDAAGFRRWLKSLEAARDRAEVLLKNPDVIWHQLSDQAANTRYAYIALDELP